MTTKLETFIWRSKYASSDTKKLIKLIKKYGLGENPTKAENLFELIHCQASPSVVAALEISDDFVCFPVSTDLEICLFMNERLGGEIVGRVGNIFVQRNMWATKDELIINKKKKIVVEFSFK